MIQTKCDLERRSHPPLVRNKDDINTPNKRANNSRSHCYAEWYLFEGNMQPPLGQFGTHRVYSAWIKGQQRRKRKRAEEVFDGARAHKPLHWSKASLCAILILYFYSGRLRTSYLHFAQFQRATFDECYVLMWRGQYGDIRKRRATTNGLHIPSEQTLHPQ